MGGKFEHEGIHVITRQLVKKCISEKIKSSMLYENIVLIGGTSEFNNIGIRMQREMNKIIPKGKKAIITATENRRFASWIGGSLLATMGSFEKLWISKKKYEEKGANIINERCPI